MAVKKDKPRALGELLPKLESRATAGGTAWLQHIEEHALPGETWGQADARLRREMKKARANPTEEQEKEAAETPAQLFLPGMQEVMRAMPNHIARSSLFAPVKSGRKRMYDGAILVSRKDAIIKFTGKQLDEAQSDIWMHAMYLAMQQPLGEAVEINRADFLRALGRVKSGENYKWLHAGFRDLTIGMLEFETIRNGKSKLSIGRTHALHMVSGFYYDDEKETYSYRIDPRWRLMYGNKEFALIDWDKRRRFGRNQDIAKALQRLVAASSDKVQKYSLKWLKEKMEYSSPIRKFKEAVSLACEELIRLEIVIKWDIEESKKGDAQLAIWLPEKPC